MLTTVVVAVLVLAGACSNEEEFTRDDFITTLTDQGYFEPMAECMADGLIEEFGIEKMTAAQEPNDDDRAIYSAVLSDCVEEVGIDNVGTGEILEGLDCSFLLDEDERARCESVASGSDTTDFLDRLEESDTEQPAPTAPNTTAPNTPAPSTTTPGTTSAG